MLLVEHGADVYQIDKALTSFGLKLGPFRCTFRSTSYECEIDLIELCSSVEPSVSPYS